MLTIAIDVRRINDFGFGTYIRNVVRALARLDHTHRYLLLGDEQHHEQMGVLPPNFKCVRYPIPEASPRNILALYRLLRQQHVDVLHIPHYRWIPQKLPCAYVVTVHDLVEFVYPERRRSRLTSNVVYALVRRSLRNAARIIAVSQTTRRDIMRIFGIPRQQIEVVYNAIDERFLRGHASAEERRLIAERYAIQYPFILYVGNVRPHKNVEKIIEAFAALKADLAKTGHFPGLKLIIIGDELSKHGQLRRTVIRTRMEADVRFLGFVPIDTLRIFYDTAKAFVFPSRYEGFGLPPLEAMAHGTPVVTSNTSSLPEVVQHAALLVNPENIFDIMRALRQCLLDRATRDQLKERGYRQVAQYSWERSALRLIDIYTEVSAGQAQPSREGVEVRAVR